MTPRTRILFVCLGNICRSPLAEGVFRDYVTALGIADQFEIDSAGTSGWHNGEMPDRGSVRVAHENGIDIRGQRSRKLVESDFENFDYIVGMDASNLKKIRNVRVPREGQLLLMRDYDPAARGADVPDPWGNGDEAFREVFEILVRCMPEFHARIQGGSEACLAR